jgi:hypothetical protein
VVPIRSLLFSKWFFALLFFASLVDLGADIADVAHFQFRTILDYASIVMSIVIAVLAGWMFVDLHTRRPS